MSERDLINTKNEPIKPDWTMPERNYEDVKIKNEPFDSKARVIHVDSIFDENIIQNNKEEVSRNFDALLKNFGDNMNTTEEGRKVIEYFNDGKVSGSKLAYVIGAKLSPNRLGSEVPGVKDMLEIGNNIMVRGDDGKPTTFTDKYFMNNNAVKEFAEKEHEANQNTGYGGFMAAFLYAYLAESNNKDLKNYNETFKQQGIDKVPVFFKDVNNNVHAIVDKQSHLEYDKEIDKIIANNKEYKDEYASEKQKFDNLTKEKNEFNAVLKTAQDDREKALDDHQKAQDDFNKKYPEEPKVPDKPVEKSRWRRFFHAIGLAPHSKKYIERKREYDSKVAEHEQYVAEKEVVDKKAEALNKAGENLENATAKAEEFDKNLHELDEKLESIKKSIGNVSPDEVKKFESNEKANYAGMAANAAEFTDDFFSKREVKRAKENVDFAMKDKGGLGAIDKSVIFKFEQGGLHQMMSMLNDKKSAKVYLRSEVMALNSPETLDKHKEKINKSNMSDKDKRKTMQYYLNKEYELQTMKAVKLFENTFSMKATPANVQAVMDAMGFEQQVNNRLQNVDKKKLDGTNKVPKVNSKNVNDMTLALMAGIKTAIKDGAIVAQAGEAEYSYPTKKNSKVRETSIVSMSKKFNGQDKGSAKPKHSDMVKALPEGQKVSENKSRI